jgi:guanylate kinase
MPPNLRPIVISGPSGAGKSTISKRILAAHPQRFAFSVSHTTRSPRPGESHGTDYHYVSRDEFEQVRGAGGFIETAEFSGNLYGTSFAAVEAVQRERKVCLLDIEMEGVKQFKKSHIEARYLFVEPVSYGANVAVVAGRAIGRARAAKRANFGGPDGLTD